MTAPQRTEAGALRHERSLLRESRLELRAKDAASWADYVAGGQGDTPEARAQRKATMARLDLELHRLDAKLAIFERAKGAHRARSLLSHLHDVLREQNLEPLWELARARSEAEASSILAAAAAETDERTEQDTAQRLELQSRLSTA